MNKTYLPQFSNFVYSPTSMSLLNNEIVAANQAKKGNFWDTIGNGLGALDQAVSILNKAKSGKTTPGTTTDPVYAQPETSTQDKAGESRSFNYSTIILIVGSLVVLAGLYVAFKKIK